VALPDLRQPASFVAHKKSMGPECSAARLGRTACDSEFANSLLEGGSLHSKLCCRSVEARHNPVALLQGLADLLTFRLLQDIVKGTAGGRL
jgi:hypothetical protein